MKANQEIAERYLIKIRKLRKENPEKAADSEREFEEWEQQVHSVLIEPILEPFRQVRQKLRGE